MRKKRAAVASESSAASPECMVQEVPVRLLGTDVTMLGAKYPWSLRFSAVNGKSPLGRICPCRFHPNCSKKEA